MSLCRSWRLTRKTEGSVALEEVIVVRNVASRILAKCVESSRRKLDVGWSDKGIGEASDHVVDGDRLALFSILSFNHVEHRSGFVNKMLAQLGEKFVIGASRKSGAKVDGVLRKAFFGGKLVQLGSAKRVSGKVRLRKRRLWLQRRLPRDERRLRL